MKLFTKNLGESGNGTNVDVGTSLTMATADRRLVAEWGPSTGIGLGRLVRYQVQVTTPANGTATFRILDPVWFDAVRA